MVAIIPMAGRGSRYTSQGYETPKPLIPVAGKPMVLWALKSLQGIHFSKHIVIALKEHEERHDISKLLRSNISGNVEFVLLDKTTEGQLCTVLEAKHLFDPEESLLVSSSDTFVESSIGNDIQHSKAGGIISVANLQGEQWSFARTDEKGNVVEVAEKRRISDHASTGLYYFKKASELIHFGEEMIRNKETTRGEYYLIPVYQRLINAGITVGISKANAMWDMGTPEAKGRFEEFIHAK